MATDFNYFDQFQLVEINLTPYLESIKADSGYDYTFTNIQPIKTTLANIFEKIDLIIDFRQDILNFDSYNIQDGERIENVSYNVYGTVDHWWVIALVNNIKNVFTDWPLTTDNLNMLIDDLVTTEGLYSRKGYHDLLFEANESKRKLMLPKPLYINPITTRFREAFQASLVQ